MRASVIITMYNSEGTIGKIIDQLLKVINKDDEIVIVDDKSNDNSAKIVGDYQDTRINLILSEHIGRAKALNKAVNASKGEYIFINDADDISSQVRFNDSIDLLENDADAIFGQALIINNVAETETESINSAMNKLNNGKLKKIVSLKKNSFFKTNKLHHSSLAIKRKFLLNVGCYDESLDVCIDLDLYFKLVQSKIKLALCEKIFIARNIGNSRFFANYPKRKYIMNLILLRKKYRKIIKPSIFTLLYDLKLKVLYLLSK